MESVELPGLVEGRTSQKSVLYIIRYRAPANLALLKPFTCWRGESGCGARVAYPLRGKMWPTSSIRISVDRKPICL